jgi:hypothetical protein
MDLLAVRPCAADSMTRCRRRSGDEGLTAADAGGAAGGAAQAAAEHRDRRGVDRHLIGGVEVEDQVPRLGRGAGPSALGERIEEQRDGTTLPRRHIRTGIPLRVAIAQ